MFSAIAAHELSAAPELHRIGKLALAQLTTAEDEASRGLAPTPQPPGPLSDYAPSETDAGDVAAPARGVLGADPAAEREPDDGARGGRPEDAVGVTALPPLLPSGRVTGASTPSTSS